MFFRKIFRKLFTKIIQKIFRHRKLSRQNLFFALNPDPGFCHCPRTKWQGYASGVARRRGGEARFSIVCYF